MDKQENILHLLTTYWNHSSFRPLQEEIILTAIDHKDLIAVLPTGGGKSVCFQIPGLYDNKLTIVITPLISLMEDQVQKLKQLGINAEFIHGGIHYKDLDRILDNCTFGQTKFLYVSPERIQSERFLERYLNMDVCRIVVDEAHCISQWGHDFRPSYLNIFQLRKIKPLIPIMAVTGSATPRVKKDIEEQLQLKDTTIFQSSFLMEQLSYQIIATNTKHTELAKQIKTLDGCGIVYASTRKQTREIAEQLVQLGVKANYYHAGLNYTQRKEVQNSWMQNKIRVIVATNAFGMGIDKADVRFVLHYSPPSSIENYYQETGRAGRDRKASNAIMFYDKSVDKEELVKQHQQKFPSVDTIKKTYNSVCNFFQVALGELLPEEKSFDLKLFAHNFKLGFTDAYYAFRELHRQQFIRFTESTQKGSNQFKFELLLPRSSENELRFNKKLYQQKLESEEEKFQGILNLLETEQCISSTICSYFGETTPYCGNCSNCNTVSNQELLSKAEIFDLIHGKTIIQIRETLLQKNIDFKPVGILIDKNLSMDEIEIVNSVYWIKKKKLLP